MIIPTELRNTLTEMAQREQRSLTGQIIILLTEALELRRVRDEEHLARMSQVNRAMFEGAARARPR